ncbi:MurR/RpiR family transcriptional regulator [Brevibacillus sp. B_LB10_24]|uniref:MurR/RpiR family transcriptional regulator n=1 Tax=Brevibacillus sp. B_LB10_24 TaxID=3380645 RepID=UPI0038BADCD8
MDSSVKPLKSIISNSQLTKKEDLVAEYILDNLTDACFITSTELANRLHVSNATIIRFSRKLGFAGYSDFQKYLRELCYESSLAISDDVTIPSERLKLSYDKVKDADLLNDNLKILEKNIRSISEKNTLDELNKTTNYIINARRVYIIGSRARTGLTDIMGLLLNMIIDHVVINSSNSFTPFDTLANCREDDCVIILSFPRYSHVDFTAAKMASEAKAKVIIITDKATAPIAQFADVLLLVSVDSNAFYNSYTPVLFLTELICSHINRATGIQNKEKLERINTYISDLDMY